MSAAAESAHYQSYKFRNYATIFRKKTIFAEVKTGCFDFFTDYWFIGRVVLDPAVHYLGPRGVVSSNDQHISIDLPFCFTR